MAASFPDTVAAVLEAENTDPKLLTPEVTESVFVRDSRRALIVLNDLQGSRGHDRPGRLRHRLLIAELPHQFPVDIVKIEIIVTAIVHLAHACT